MKYCYSARQLFIVKALKNAVEAEGARIAHTKDAVAMISFIYWLEQNWQTGVDEINAADKLEEFRESAG